MTPMENYLKILGFSPEDKSVYAEQARVWVMATCDNDETWFERRKPETIRRAWIRYRRRVYGN